MAEIFFLTFYFYLLNALLGIKLLCLFTHCLCFVVLSTLLPGPRLNSAAHWRSHCLKPPRVALLYTCQQHIFIGSFTVAYFAV